MRWRAMCIGVCAGVAGLCMLSKESAAERAEGATRPATTRAVVWPVEVMRIQGVVQVREDKDRPWAKALVGMKLGEKSQVRTGPRSEVTLRIADGREIVVDRLRTSKVAELAEDAGRTRPDLGMQYGRVKYDIETAGQEHDPAIHSSTPTVVGRKSPPPPGFWSWSGVRMSPVASMTQPAMRPVAVPLTEPVPATTRPAIAWPREVVGVEGIAQARESNEKPWGRLSGGMKLGVKAELRLGPRSAVRLRMADGRELTWDRFGTTKLDEVPRALELPHHRNYGRVRYEIEAAGTEHVSTIVTPGSVMPNRHQGATQPAWRWQLVWPWPPQLTLVPTTQPAARGN